MRNADTKISALTGELAPILEKYPVYRSEVAEQLGLILPTLPSPTLRVIEIVDGDYRKDEQKNVVSDTKPSKYAESNNCLDDNSLDNQTELPATENASKDVDVTWYNSISGKVSAGSEKRYFRLLWNNKQNQHQVGLKKSESAKRWSKDINSTTQPLIDAVWQEFKAGKPDETEIILQKLCKAAEEVGGRFTEEIGSNVGKLGIFTPNWKEEYFGEEGVEVIELGYNDGSWWYIRPGRNKVYCSGNIHAFTEILKGLKTDIVLESQKSSDRVTPQHKTAAITQIETAEAKLDNNTTVTWHDSNSGEVSRGTVTRYFQFLWDGNQGDYRIRLKTSESSHRWCKDDTPINKLLIDAVWRSPNVPNYGKKSKEKALSISIKSSDCWYTPPEIVELVELVLGKIDLDPCSDDGKHIPAKYHKTIREDGLACVWFGKVFINPPYSCPGKWIEKLISEVNDSNVTEAIALLPASTDTKWFAPLWNQPICFWKGRIKFLDTNYQPKLPARQSHCLVYWGKNTDKFNEVFSKYGEVKTSTNSQSTEVETTLPLIKKIESLVSEKWVLEAIDDSQVMLYETDDKNSSDWVKITDLYESQGLFFISHETAFSNHAKTIEEAVERAEWWFNQDIIDSLEYFIDILNGYNTDLIATRNNSTTAYIHQDKELFGTVFFKDDERLELPEREKQLLRDSYSIDIDNLIEDIQSQGEINPNDYLMGIGKLGVEFNKADIIQNALHSLSNMNDLVIVRQEKIFKFYNDERLEDWLGDDLGTIKVIDSSDIVIDEQLNHLLFEKYSILADDLITDIFNNKYEDNPEDYIISNQNIKELITKENWDDKEFEIAERLLSELFYCSPAWNKLNDVKNQQFMKPSEEKFVDSNTLVANEPYLEEEDDFNFFSEVDDDDPTWMDVIKAEIEKLEGFKVTHDEVDLTVTHYGTVVGSIHHNEKYELEIEQKLIGELAKYDFNLEAFLVSAEISYKFYHLRPKSSGDHTQSSSSEQGELEVKKPQTG
ncbi:MAG: hypothetical protein F6K23_36860 [Okeania sp. SIO2C9]|nr:hypothetical protein [Okeania sp. SIO2C9]